MVRHGHNSASVVRSAPWLHCLIWKKRLPSWSSLYWGYIVQPAGVSSTYLAYNGHPKPTRLDLCPFRKYSTRSLVAWSPAGLLWKTKAPKLLSDWTSASISEKVNIVMSRHELSSCYVSFLHKPPQNRTVTCLTISTNLLYTLAHTLPLHLSPSCSACVCNTPCSS